MDEKRRHKHAKEKKEQAGGYSGAHRLADTRNVHGYSAYTNLWGVGEPVPYAWMPEMYADELRGEDPETDFPEL